MNTSADDNYSPMNNATLSFMNVPLLMKVATSMLAHSGARQTGVQQCLDSTMMMPHKLTFQRLHHRLLEPLTRLPYHAKGCIASATPTFEVPVPL